MEQIQQQPGAQAQPTTTQEQGTQGWIKIAMAAIFYVGLTVYLLGSIDHVAWFFHLYEPPDTWTVPSYGKAGALDLAIFFLAYVAATGQTADKVLTWTFTAILSCVSLYANYMYAMFFSPEHQSDVWSIHILWGLTTTGWLSPIIASSYPLFAIIFMYLIERVISRRAETADEMRERLQTLKEKKEIEREIKAVTKGEVKGTAIEVIDSGLDVFNHVRGRFARKLQTSIKEPSAQQEDRVEEHATGTLDESNINSTTREDDLQSGVNEDSENASRASQSGGNEERSDPSTLSSTLPAMERLHGLSSGSCLSLEEAAEVLGITLQYAKTMRSKGQLTTHPKNEAIVTVASVKKALEARAKADKRSGAFRLLPFNQSSTNGVQAQDKLEITLGIMREHPTITDEALAPLLHLKRPASAQFWRLKAQELLLQTEANQPPTTDQPAVIESL